MPTIRASAASGTWPTAVMVAGEHDERAAGDSGGALAGEHHDADHDQLLLPGQVDADGLGQEQGGHGQVDRGSVEVEGEPGRDDDADNGFADAEVFELAYQLGQDASLEQVLRAMSSSALR